MSYTKEHLMGRIESTPLDRVMAEMMHAEALHERETLERLAWEAKRAMNDYLDALTRYEKRIADAAGRRADAEILAGHDPF